MLKFTCFLLLHAVVLMSAQLLTVNNLKHLSTAQTHEIDTKLINHFDFLRHKDEDENNVRVFSNQHLENSPLSVVTVFIKNSECHVFSVVCHDESMVSEFQNELVKEQFEEHSVSDKDGNPVKIFLKEKMKVLMKKPHASVSAHQIVWMCKE